MAGLRMIYVRTARLLVDETFFIVGYGAIGRRLSELLAPYPVRVHGYRRTPQVGFRYSRSRPSGAGQQPC